MSVASINQLIKAGVHFGHRTRTWNPKMRSYIYGERNGVYIIDLMQTSIALDSACNFLQSLSQKKKNIVFVGTKRQASQIVEFEAKRCNSYYINRRWLGGMLTNFETIRLRLNHLRKLDEMIESGDFYRMPKKEQSVRHREHSQLQKSLGGLKNMRGLPDALCIIDPNHEKTAVLEAKKLGIPVIAVVDTNCDPTGIDHVIPGNDDSLSSISLLMRCLGDAILGDEPEFNGHEEKQHTPSADAPPQGPTTLPPIIEGSEPGLGGLGSPVAHANVEENENN